MSRIFIIIFTEIKTVRLKAYCINISLLILNVNLRKVDLSVVQIL